MHSDDVPLLKSEVFGICFFFRERQVVFENKVPFPALAAIPLMRRTRSVPAGDFEDSAPNSASCRVLPCRDPAGRLAR
ncbi:hypothetical protein V5799_014653 [Amblyomma americanum]|uniref:Uncharacterized protein n=1 Tax=Amblyomma americanum TaxID=6943 RepID=A0AAQ4E2E3_AMBAM